jgi:endonuclease YncB( thermonuclease family)
MEKQILLHFLFFLCSHPVFTNFIQGIARVIDGDSLVINKQRIRLQYIDAPELNQICDQGKEMGLEAKIFLQQFIKSTSIRCEYNEVDQYNRKLATCFKNTVNLNELMVKQGLAFNYDYHGNNYKSQEIIAKNEGRGIWKYNCKLPYEYRRYKKRKNEF